MELELEKLSRDELVRLSKDVQKALSSFNDRRKQEALIEMQEVARRHGLDLSEVVGGKKGASLAAPKYRHPENPSLTWAGRGRKPRWLLEELEKGRQMDDLRV